MIHETYKFNILSEVFRDINQLQFCQPLLCETKTSAQSSGFKTADENLYLRWKIQHCRSLYHIEGHRHKDLTFLLKTVPPSVPPNQILVLCTQKDQSQLSEQQHITVRSFKNVFR